MSGFEIVIVVVVGIGAVAAVALLATNGSTWKQYAQSHLLTDRDAAASSKPGSTAAALEREQEIRELLTARNELRRRRGETTVDVERELRRLTAPAIDPALRDEIRQLVIARNHRRQRTGKSPLDVEAEVERTISELGG